VILPLFERLKLVVLLLLGACQKSPQLARSPAANVAAVTPAQRLIFIAAPIFPDNRIQPQQYLNSMLDASPPEFAYHDGKLSSSRPKLIDS
jgi:hypothetical protein